MIKLKSLLESNDYRGHHTAPDKSSGTPIYKANEIWPDDIYSLRAAQYYGDRSSDYSDQLSISIIQQTRNKPNMPIQIYRAIPLEDYQINPGDWVTINRDYAKSHGESTLYGKYHILTKTVPAKHLYTTADSIHEWGYDPS